MVTVQQVAAGGVDPVMADPLAGSVRGWVEPFGALDRFGAVTGFHGESHRPDRHVGRAEEQPIVVPIDADPSGRLARLGEVVIGGGEVTGAGGGQTGLQVQVAPGGQGGGIGPAELVLDAGSGALQ